MEARLRKTFHYPTDDSSNDSPADVLDDEEQENLIQTLHDDNEARNAQFRLALMALPALASIPYLICLFRLSTFLLSVLSLTSLSSTAWLLHRQEPSITGILSLDAWARRGGPPRSRSQADDSGDTGPSSASSSAADVRRHVGTPSGNRQSQQRRRRLSSFSLPGGISQQQAHLSPMEAHLPLLNGALCALLLLMGLIGLVRPDSARAAEGPSYSILAAVPAVIYVVVLASKVVMAGVDPEDALGPLRYDYKGA